MKLQGLLYDNVLKAAQKTLLIIVCFNVPMSNETKANITTITRTECGNLAVSTPLMPAQNVSGHLT